MPDAVSDAVPDAVFAGLDAEAVRAWSRIAVDLMGERRAEIDALNVFPVADSDTGSNVLATLCAADAALSASPARSAGAALSALADGAAGSAAGNSGFLLSQLLQGLADAADAAGTAAAHPAGTAVVDGATFAAGLQRGTSLARAAVVAPVEGTILTVAAAAADAAALAATGTAGTGTGTATGTATGATGALRAAPTFGDVLGAAVTAADRALQATPHQLRALADAGVVDAGGRALLVVLDALVRVVTGRPAVLTPVHPSRQEHRSAPLELPAPTAQTSPAFEVQYRLHAPAAAVDDLRSALAKLGGSVVIVAVGPAPDAWNVHAHVDDVGAAIEAGVDAGRPSGISVVRFADLPAPGRVPARSGVTADDPDAGRGHPDGDIAVLAIAPGAGLTQLFENEGVAVVGEGHDLPSVADVTTAIGHCGADEVVLLPNAARITGVAEAAAAHARRAGMRVAVVPTRSPVQALAAVAVHDPQRRFVDDVVAMAEAAAACRHAELTMAGSQALTAVGMCERGDILGLIDGEVVEVGHGLAAVAFTIVDRLLGVGAELMTVLVGDAAPPNIGMLVDAHVRARAPLTDISVYAAGRLDDLVIIGVE